VNIPILTSPSLNVNLTIASPLLVTYSLSSILVSHLSNLTKSFLTSNGMLFCSNSSKSIFPLKLAVIDFLSLTENLSKFLSKVIELIMPAFVAINAANYG